jgi:hypothetical protein
MPKRDDFDDDDDDDDDDEKKRGDDDDAVVVTLGWTRVVVGGGGGGGVGGGVGADETTGVDIARDGVKRGFNIAENVAPGYIVERDVIAAVRADIVLRCCVVLIMRTGGRQFSGERGMVVTPRVTRRAASSVRTRELIIALMWSWQNGLRRRELCCKSGRRVYCVLPSAERSRKRQKKLISSTVSTTWPLGISSKHLDRVVVMWVVAPSHFFDI